MNSCHVISYRLKGNHEKHSLVFSIKWQLTTETLPSCVGWEKNENHKLMPRKVDLKHVLDPLCLAENSVDLNLKLMRWRLVPSLDLDKISSTDINELRVHLITKKTLIEYTNQLFDSLSLYANKSINIIEENKK